MVGSKTTHRSKIWPLLTLVWVLILATGCIQQEAAPVPPQGSETLPVSQTEWETVEELIAAAEAEGGNLMVYSSMNIDDLEIILGQFQATYPFTRPEYYRASGDSMIQKALIEAQAGQQFADVFETQAFEVHRLMQEGLFDRFVAPESAAYPPQAKDADGYWTMDRINPVVIGYNTELVAPEDVPTRWEDLLDPRWRGLIGVEASDVELLSIMIQHWGEADALELWEGIAALDPGVVDGHTALAELVAAGEFAIAPNLYAYRVEDLKAKGAPIEWVKTEPVFTYPQMVAVANGAPNPATARLFVNWLLSEAGQNALLSVGRPPARPVADGGEASFTAGLTLVFTAPADAENYDYYAEKWNSILGLE